MKSGILLYIGLTSTLLLSFSFPLKDKFLLITVSLWVLFWLSEGNLKTKFIGFNYKNPLYIALSIYFILIVISSILTGSISDAWFQIQKKLSLVFFPIIFAGANKKIKSNTNLILLAFVIANLVVSVYLLTNTFFSNLIIENGHWHIKYWAWPKFKTYTFFELINNRMNVFSYGFLSKFIHPSYFSMYILFSIIILVYLLRTNFFNKPMYKYISIIVIFYFIGFIYLLQSRAVFFALALTIFFVFLFEILRKKQKRYFFTGIVILSIGIIIILSSTRMQKVIKQTSSLLKNPEKIELRKMDARFQTNYAAIQIIKENFWFGVGLPNIYDELEKQYEKSDFKTVAKERLNTHNQYLETFAGMGVFGFLALMYILIGGFIHAYKHKHYLLFFLLLILSINFLFESMLVRANGIVFMMFFYSMFVFMEPKTESQT